MTDEEIDKIPQMCWIGNQMVKGYDIQVKQMCKQMTVCEILKPWMVKVIWCVAIVKGKTCSEEEKLCDSL